MRKRKKDKHMQTCHPYRPYCQALAGALAGSLALACARIVWMCACGNKVNKVNKNINIYYITTYNGPLLPTYPPYCQAAGWFLPGATLSVWPKGTAAKGISVCTAGGNASHA